MPQESLVEIVTRLREWLVTGAPAPHTTKLAAVGRETLQRLLDAVEAGGACARQLASMAAVADGREFEAAKAAGRRTRWTCMDCRVSAYSGWNPDCRLCGPLFRWERASGVVLIEQDRDERVDGVEE